jgi:hypothetical protein
VKLFDENYQKTPETAALVDHHYEGEWVHTLLLPTRQIERLKFKTNAPINSRADGRLQIEWEESSPVIVIRWRDVTAAIRSLLRGGDVVDDHWAANAYLFCAVAEQQIMGFQSQSAIEKMADPDGVVDTIRPISLASGLGEQLSFLRARQSL